MLGDLFDDCLQIDPAGRTAEVLKPLPACKGVLLFADDNDRPIQLLTAADIRRTAAARLCTLGPAASKKRSDISHITRKIYYCTCYNDFASALAHYRIAKAIYPDTYTEVLILPRQTYVTIDPAAKWPFFSLTDKPGVWSGQDVFGPCQRPALLAGGRDPASCPYLQMNCCPAPCVGKLRRAEYLRQIDDALCAAVGNVEKYVIKLKIRMKLLARERAFEQAQLLKKQLDHLKLLDRGEYRWITKMPALTILHIDRSEKIAYEGK